MVAVIRAIVLAAIAQVAILALLIGYLFVHADNMSQVYAAIAERNANTYTEQVVRNQYNRLQLEQSQSREDMHTWIDRRIELRLSQLPKEHKQ